MVMNLTIYFPENYEQCIIKRNTLVKDLSIVFNNLEKEEPVIESHIADKTGNSTMNSFVFWFNNDDLVMVVCYDWTEQMQFYDNLKIQLLKNDLNNWLIGN